MTYHVIVKAAKAFKVEAGCPLEAIIICQKECTVSKFDVIEAQCTDPENNSPQSKYSKMGPTLEDIAWEMCPQKTTK